MEETGEWNATGYADNFSFVAQYGKGLIDLIESPAGSRVLDLGCGNGTLTQELHGRGYDAMGLDSSPSLLRLARESHPELTFMEGDACCFSLEEPVDVVFSNAVLHWIKPDRHAAMLRCVSDALRPGGEFIAEFGGHGNNKLIHEALRQAFSRRGMTYEMPFYFPTIGRYAPLVEAHGMRLTHAWLFPRMTPLKGEDGMENWLRMFIRQPFKDCSQSIANDIIAETARALRPALYRSGTWHADYVRLRLRAVKTE